MQNFEYCTPTRLFFGQGVVEKLPEVMNRYGKKILLSYGGGSIKKIGLYDKVKELLKDFEIVELSGIQPNPKYDPSVLDGVKLCKENDVDVILSVGGESVLDCSKAIAAGAKYDGDSWASKQESVTGYDEPRPRSYSMWKVSEEELETVVEDNRIDLKYFE